MNQINYLLPNTVTPLPNSTVDQLKSEAINSLLSFNSQNTSERLEDIAKIVSNSLQSSKPIGFKDLNGLLESLLVWSLNTPYILVNSQGTETLTPHYLHYLSSNDNKDNYVPYSIASLIQDGCTYTWGGFFGTLGFELYLNRTQNHYLSVSQLVDIIITSLVNRLKKSGTTDFSLLMNSVTQGLIKDDVETDIQLYRLPITFLQSFRTLGVSTQLLESVLKLNDLIHLNFLTSIKEEFRSMYQELYMILVNYPLDSSIQSFHLFHTDINNSLIELTNKLYEWCIRVNTELQKTNHTELINICKNIQDAFKQVNGINPIQQLKHDLLLLPLPGGFNQLIILSSLMLLHRAYILTHPSKLPELLLQPFEKVQVKYDSLIYSNNSFMDQVLSRQKQEGLFSRVMSLLYLAGRILRKSNIRDYILMGNNLCYISGWRDTDNTNITALID